MQTATHNQLWHQRNAEVKKQVCQLLHWTEMEYAQYQYQMGIAYLMWYLPVNESLRAEYERSKLFWNWFKNIWLCYDESWCSFKLSLQECSKEKRLQLYKNLHCPRALVMDEKPTALYASIKKEVAA